VKRATNHIKLTWRSPRGAVERADRRRG
jgi:hypothetical protein